MDTHRSIIERRSHDKPVRGLRGECELLSCDDEMVWLEGVQHPCRIQAALNNGSGGTPNPRESHGYWARAFGGGSLTTSQYKPS
jgi:hypothetical protein